MQQFAEKILALPNKTILINVRLHEYVHLTSD